MERLDCYVQRRHELAERYNRLLQPLPLTIPWQHQDSYSGLHLYVIRLNSGNHRAVFEALRAAGIGVNLHYIPVHTQPYYQQFGFSLGDFPEAGRYYAEAISLPLYYGLDETTQDYVIESIKTIFSTAHQ
jgi:dTDP-4-amino-4,6-dideoxygalactose transaminase